MRFAGGDLLERHVPADAGHPDQRADLPYPEFALDKLFGFDGLLPVAMLHYLSATAILLFRCRISIGTTGVISSARCSR